MYDCIVIGAGIVGSAAAYNLAKNGTKTLLIEQFALPHSRGSSTGQTRITRHAYQERFFTEMMCEAFSEWSDIEKQANTNLYKKCGLMWIDTHPYKSLTKVESNLKEFCIPYHCISSNNLKTKYNMITFDNSYKGIYDETGGVLKANKALICFQELFKRYGGQIYDGVKILKIEPGQVITLISAAGTFSGRHVIVCAGPWTSKLLSPLGLYLPLEVIHVGVYYWKEKHLGLYSSKNGFPCFIDATVGNGGYAVPSDEYPGFLKFRCNGGVSTDADTRDDVDVSNIYKQNQQYVKDHFPFLEDKPSIYESCLYTKTPDEIFILDYHPKFSNIIIGAGFSGTGFKIAPVVGKILTNMVLQRPQAYDLSPFAISRFKNLELKSSL